MQKCIVPRVAGSHSSFPVGALIIDFLQLRIDPIWLPAEPERNMDGMQSQIAHHADFATCFNLALPIARFGRIEVAAVVETGMDLQAVDRASLRRDLVRALGTGKKRKFGTAPNESP